MQKSTIMTTNDLLLNLNNQLDSIERIVESLDDYVRSDAYFASKICVCADYIDEFEQNPSIDNYLRVNAHLTTLLIEVSETF